MTEPIPARPAPEDNEPTGLRKVLAHRCRQCRKPLPKGQDFCDDKCRDEFEETSAW